MTNAEKFVEVFGTDIKRQYSTKSWWEQEFIPNKAIPTGWIPCEKRLPDKLQDVLITFYDAEGEYDVAYMRKTFNATYKAQGSENEWVSSMGETTYADYEVSAWMPIEPYKASPEVAEGSSKG